MNKNHPIFQNFPFMNGDLDSFEVDNKYIFVLMPFGNNAEDKKTFNELYLTMKSIIEEACFHGNILKCSRADSEEGLIIMDDICKKIKSAGLTIFDISIPNTNVYFELGLACALDKKILITYNPNLYYNNNPKKNLPFDINQFRYIEYKDHSDLESQLKFKVEQIIKLEDYTKIDLKKVYSKIQKITRHFNLDTRAEQIKDDNDITDYEINKTSDVLDEYWNNPELVKNNFAGIDYMKLELKIREAIGTNYYQKVKEILRYLYWAGFYQDLIANIEMIPAELSEIKRDYKEKSQKKE